LGNERAYLPQRRGFDEFFGFLGGVHPYFTPDAKEENGTGLGPANAGARQAPIFRGTEPVKEAAYLTEPFAREASAYVARNKDNPYFLYLAFNGVHAPLQAPKKYVDRFPGLTGKRQATPRC
jgi:arylsulfatase A-like enzyme